MSLFDLRIKTAHHCSHFREICIRPLILGHSFDSSGLNAELADGSLDPGIQGVAGHENFAGHGWCFLGADWSTMHFLWVRALGVALHCKFAFEAHCRRWVESGGTSPGSRQVLPQVGTSIAIERDGEESSKACASTEQKGTEPPSSRTRKGDSERRCIRSIRERVEVTDNFCLRTRTQLHRSSLISS